MAEASKAIAKHGLSDTCTVLGGDFFESVPQGADAYIMKWVIHDWDDQHATRILKNCRRAMSDDGKVIIVDAIIPGPNEPSPGKLMDLNMLVMTGGIGRTREEFATLLDTCDLRLVRAIPTPSPFSILEAVKK